MTLKYISPYRKRYAILKITSIRIEFAKTARNKKVKFDIAVREAHRKLVFS
jgi:hypothetical protein